MSRLGRTVALAAVGVVAAVALPTAPSTAAPISSCTASTGTIIAVDYAHWGGPVVRGCDTMNPKRGIDLLNDAGFVTTGTQHDGPSFLCRIGNDAFGNGTQYPTPGDDPCVVTPPASAYWSYWLAAAGQNHWSYSQLGAFSEKPKPGEVELWIFGGTHIQGGQGDPTDGFPTCTPASLRAGGSPTRCTPGGSGSSGGGSGSGGGAGSSGSGSGGSGSDTKSDGAGSGSRGSGGGSGGSSGSDGSGNGDAPSAVGGSRSTRTGAAPSSGTASTGSHAPSTTVTGGAAAPTSGSGPSTSVDGSVLVDAKQHSGGIDTGSVVPLVVGLALAAILLGGGAATVVRRRRSAD